jgi:hypothetical protein
LGIGNTLSPCYHNAGAKLTTPNSSHWINGQEDLDNCEAFHLTSKSFDNACGISSRQLIRRPTTGFATRIARKTFTLVAHSDPGSAPQPVLPCSTPGRPSSPLAATAQHSAVSAGPCWGLWLRSVVVLVLALALDFSLQHLFTTSSTDSFDIAARYISAFIPSCLDLVVRLSLSYRHRQSQHSLRDTQKQRAPTNSLFLYQTAPSISTTFPRDVDDFYSTYIFTSTSLSTKLLP